MGASLKLSKGATGLLAQPAPTLANTDPNADVMSATNGVVFVRSGAGGRTAFGKWISATPPGWSP